MSLFLAMAPDPGRRYHHNPAPPVVIRMSLFLAMAPDPGRRYHHNPPPPVAWGRLPSGVDTAPSVP